MGGDESADGRAEQGGEEGRLAPLVELLLGELTELAAEHRPGEWTAIVTCRLDDRGQMRVDAAVSGRKDEGYWHGETVTWRTDRHPERAPRPPQTLTHLAGLLGQGE